MDSIIFDLDGTIWDPIDTVLGAWNSILTREEMNELTREELAATMGMQMDEVGMKLFPALSEERREQLIHECWSLETAFLAKRGGALYENVENVLAELSQKYKLYIVSNCQDGYIEVFYEYHKLEKYFLDFENPGRTSLSKGENINLVIERNSLSKPVYVGDTQGDLNAAKFAGIPFIYAKYGFGQASEYDEAVESFDELLRVFRNGND
ncbi:HAD family hydrolase [Planococcus sp. APC 3906]|uniref:HAD family hydrolase n=1 Tax=Planococcus sp. APC 3906 TaxID=3035194 RepID=UPI0025B37085|nr:HAD family hydrolase [Planococcus sp. APC 3906]MDN3450371.1 HAD family hydrolase [Planococcus sp. APC 3906]